MSARLLAYLIALTTSIALLGCTESADESSDGDGTADTADTTDTMAEACGERPAFPELYSSCAGAGHCGASGLTCASQTGMDPVSNQAFCTQSCMNDEDCASVGDCSATAVCIIPGGSVGVCALDCADNKQCPENMMCLSDLDPDMPRDLCF